MRKRREELAARGWEKRRTKGSRALTERWGRGRHAIGMAVGSEQRERERERCGGGRSREKQRRRKTEKRKQEKKEQKRRKKKKKFLLSKN